MQLFEDTPAVLPLGKLCKEHGYTHEWPSGREPRLTKNEKQTLQNRELRSFGCSRTVIEFHHNFILDIASAGSIHIFGPSNTRSNEGAARNCSEGIPEWAEEFAENLEIAEIPAAADISHDSDLERPVKVAQYLYSLPERPKLRGLQANRNYKGSL